MVMSSHFLPSSSDHDNPNPDYNLWICHDQFLLNWLLVFIGESILGHVGCTTSCDFWTVLEHLFLSNSKACIMQLSLFLQSTKKCTMFVEGFSLKMRGFVDHLFAVGQLITDDELIMYILSDFGPEYEVLVVNTINWLDSQNFQEIQYPFQAYELHLQQQHSSMFEPSCSHCLSRSWPRCFSWLWLRLW